MNFPTKAETSKSPSRMRGKVLSHNITKISKKKLKARNSVRSFWVKYLKPELECHPQICMTKIFSRYCQSQGSINQKDQGISPPTADKKGKFQDRYPILSRSPGHIQTESQNGRRIPNTYKKTGQMV
jgi:hypothetical protein